MLDPKHRSMRVYDAPSTSQQYLSRCQVTYTADGNAQAESCSDLARSTSWQAELTCALSSALRGFPPVWTQLVPLFPESLFYLLDFKFKIGW
jgi:hypothetical protein